MATYPAINEPAPTVESLQATVRQLKEAVELLTGQRGPTVENPLSALEARLLKKIGELEASIEVKNETIVSETESLARRTTTLSSQFYNAKESDFRFKARYSEVIVTQTNKTAALASRTTLLEASVNNEVTGLAATRARLLTEEQVRATADSALAQRTSTLEATVNNSTTGLVSTRARIITEEQARAAADSALAQRATTLETTVNGQTAALSVIQNSVNGVSVKYGVTGYVNGQTGGFVFTGVARNSGGAVFNMEFNSNVTINGNLLINGSVNTGQLGANAVSVNAVGAAAYPTGTSSNIVSTSVTLTEPAYLFVAANVTQIFSGLLNSWNAQIYVNDTPIASVGGAAYQPAVALNGGIGVGTGTFTVRIDYVADPDVTAAQRTIAVWALKR